MDKPLILIADDDRNIREGLTMRLEAAGFRVTAASCASSATRMFDVLAPAAAILDVNMPDSDGFGVCEHIRQAGSEIPVFILTGADAGIIRKNLDTLTATVGANHYVTKPYDAQELIGRLQEAISAASY